MGIISSYWISILTLLMGLVLIASSKDKTLRVVGLWFVAEFSCYAVSIRFEEYATDLDIVTYLYLYSITSLIFSAFTMKNRKSYSRDIVRLFVFISFLSVPFAFFRYKIQSGWLSWGRDFYTEFGTYVDSVFFASVVSVEILMLLLGVCSAFNFGSNNNPRSGV